jgi:phosphoglycolate phosphatase-like HAD superfamily hydrolase
MDSTKALVLFDIDGTLVRRAGPHHREALVEAVKRITGVETTTDGVPVAGMLDRDILTVMMTQAGMPHYAIRSVMPDVVRRAQWIYARSCPDLETKVCPGVHSVLGRLRQLGVTTGLVTGNLTRIGWKKLERAGLRDYFRFGAFAEVAKDRAGLVRIAVGEAHRQKWIGRSSRISLIGDHPNDIQAARANRVRAIAVATGVVSYGELAALEPDVVLPDLRALDVEMLL